MKFDKDYLVNYKDYLIRISQLHTTQLIQIRHVSSRALIV